MSTKTIRAFDLTNGWSTRHTPLTKVGGDCNTWHDYISDNGFLLQDDFGDKDSSLHFDLWEADDDQQQPDGDYLLGVNLSENSQLVYCQDVVSVLELLRQYLPVASQLAKAARRERV